MDTIINEWDAALERIIRELEAQHHQSQNLLNTLQESETENLFQINAEDQ